MTGREKDTVRETRKKILYRFLILFICLLFIKISFGAISSARSLLVSGIFSLLDTLISIIALLRINDTGTARFKRRNFSYGKLEIIVAAFMSLTIVTSAAAFFYSSIHLLFNHTLYPPDMIAAWVAAIIAATIWIVLYKIREKILPLEKADSDRMISLLKREFVVSILVIITVVLSRTGFPAIDYILAIMEAATIVALSISYLLGSVKGLFDASCSRATVSEISGYMREASDELDLEEIRVTRVGKILEIVAIARLSKDTKIKEAKRLVTKIKHVLAANLSSPHEVHIGFRSREE